jgi:NAD(P)-dependent dehydrogenase (short-subunit alcohol dehydrogenase family)
MQSLADKTVWITGAGSGIGRACAIAFAGAGARVALTGRRKDALQDTAALVGDASRVLIVPADLADPAAVTAAHAAVVAGFGDPDILVNNAGTNIGRRHWKDLTVEGVQRVVDVDLVAPFACAIAVLPAMRAKGGGTLIHIASLAAVHFHPVSGASYTAAKLGVIGMSDSINAEEGIHGIRSICLSPGEVETPILNSRPIPPTEAERALMAQPDDIAAAALFCASLPARSCVTRMVVCPTDDRFWRAEARRIEAMPTPR